MKTMLAAIAALVVSGAAQAAGPKPLFASDEPLHLTIRGAVASLAGDSGSRTVPGTLTVAGAAPETLAITLAARGITRRQRDTCGFPPLRIGFVDKPPATSLFKGQSKLKLVTHCRPASGFQQFPLLEYSVYKMFNLLTPASFDARLAQIDYVDADGKANISRVGFFLEDADDVAKRNGRKRYITKDKVAVARLDPAGAARFALFEVLIGNLDWAMTAGPPGDDCCHNSRLLVAEGATDGLIPVPYDFDFAGVVDAPYATPPAAIPLPSVRVRRYRGWCRHDTEARAAAADLTAHRAAILGVLGTVPGLDERPRAKATAYLSGFLDEIATPAGLDKVLKTCLGPAGP